RASAFDRVAAVLELHDLLIRKVQAGTTALLLLLLTQSADLRQEREGGVFAAIETRLRRGVLKLCARAHERTLQAESLQRPGGVQVEGPHECGPLDAREQRGAILAESARMEGD